KRVAEAEHYWIENGIENAGDFSFLCGLCGANQRIEIAVWPRHQDRNARRTFGERDCFFVKAEHVIGAGSNSSFEFAGIGGIDAHHKAAVRQGAYAPFEMRERRIRQAAE